MILILTYHKVLRRAEDKAEFYTISAEDLLRQMDLLAASGYQPLQPEELATYQSGSKPGYLLTFDDGTLDHYEVVLPLLARYKTRGIFFVPTARLDREGYLSTAAAQEMSRLGQTIGLHSHEHRRLDTLGEEDIRVQMELSQEILGKIIGEKPVYFAPPGGFINRRVRDVALERGVKVIRTMHWGYNKKTDLAALDCVPINRFMSLAQFQQVLHFRRMAITYTLKQFTKRLIPAPTYEALRDLLFGKIRR